MRCSGYKIWLGLVSIVLISNFYPLYGQLPDSVQSRINYATDSLIILADRNLKTGNITEAASAAQQAYDLYPGMITMREWEMHS